MAEEQTISLFSFYSRNKRQELQYSLSPFEIGEMFLKFLFLLSMLEQRKYIFLFSEVENIVSDFSSQNWGIQISKLEKLFSNCSFFSRFDYFATSTTALGGGG